MLGLRLADMGSVSSGYGNSDFRMRLLRISLLITYVQYHMSCLPEGEQHTHTSYQGIGNYI